MSAQAGEQGVDVDVSVEGDGETTIEGDAEQLKTCFSNLMINAIQAMPEGGALNVSLRPSDAELTIEFTDTGSGIAPRTSSKSLNRTIRPKRRGLVSGFR
jgi:signal transduction histidine kinase